MNYTHLLRHFDSRFLEFVLENQKLNLILPTSVKSTKSDV